MMKLQHNFIEVLAFQSTKEGREYCGDSFYMTVEQDYFLCVIADGLGSGKLAYEASKVVVDFVKENVKKDIDTLIRECNDLLVNKRGAAVSLLKINLLNHEMTYTCVGNIRCYLLTPSGKITFPLPVTGYLSGRPQVYRTQRFKYEPQSKFLLHSDGLVGSYSKLLLQSGRSLEVIANEIERNQVLKTDDSTCILGSLL